MKAFSHINIGEKISFIIGCKNYLILVVSKKTDIPCANCTRPCAQCTSFNLALQALARNFFLNNLFKVLNNLFKEYPFFY